MKKNAVIIAILLFSKTIIYCQDSTVRYAFNLHLSSGFAIHTTNDQLLNYFNYKGTSLGPVNLRGSFSNNKSHCLINLFYHKSKLKPENFNQVFYEYNNLTLWVYEVDIEYYHEVLKINRNLLAFLGIADHTYLTLQEEHYSNLLYDYGYGYRRSYDLSLINISPNLLINFNITKHSFVMKTGYTVINYAARPDDNYVKQTGSGSKFTWKLYFPNDYMKTHFSVLYQYQLFRKTNLSFEYNLQYRWHRSSDKYKLLSRVFLVGIAKTF